MKHKINMQDEYYEELTGDDVQVYTVSRNHPTQKVVLETKGGYIQHLDEFGYESGNQIIIKKPVKLWVNLYATSKYEGRYRSIDTAKLNRRSNCIATISYYEGEGLEDEE